MREDLRTSEAPENVLKNEAAFINILYVVLFLLGSIFPSSSNVVGVFLSQVLPFIGSHLPPWGMA